MDLTEFRASLPDASPPASASLPLQALWWDAKGDWDKARMCAGRSRLGGRRRACIVAPQGTGPVQRALLVQPRGTDPRHGNPGPRVGGAGD